MEFSRSSDKPFDWAVKATAEMGYKYIEPMLHFGRELMCMAGYFHTVSMFDDPYCMKELCDAAGLTISGFQAHGPLCLRKCTASTSRWRSASPARSVCR